MRPDSTKLLLAAALVALAVFVCGNAAAPTAVRAADSGSVCGGQAQSSLAQPGAVASAGKGWVFAKWFGDKAAGALAGRAVNMAFDYFSRLTGLDKVLPESDAAKAVRQLEEMKVQLTGISERLEELTETVGQLISEERKSHLDAALAPLCDIVVKQQILFEQQFMPMVRAGAELGEILAGPNPEAATVKNANGLTPKTRLEALQAKFLKTYDREELTLEAGIKRIHGALVPGSLQSSVLGSFGQVLLSKRFLTRADSELLQSLYSELAEARALASWMAAEFRSTAPENPDAFQTVMSDYVRDTAQEQRNLPPMIPPGAVIDLGKTNSTTTSGKPMWFPPNEEDLAWLPDNKGWGVAAVNEVGKEVDALNDPKALGKIHGSGWAVPTKAQLTALLSDVCVADPGDPAKLVNGACKNAVGPKSGGTVAGYLQQLNPDDRTWQQLFCQSSPKRECAPGAGPAVGGAPPHAFVWTRESVGQKLKCGWTIIPPAQSSRWYATYTGFRTLATGPSQGAFPPLPEKVPGYGLQNASIAYNYCDTYFAGLARGVPSTNTPRSPWLSGVLLATRNTGADDLNPDNGLDYMAQSPPSCAGKLATIVGTKQDETIRGTSGRDVIVARGGDDVVRALGGSDLVCGNGGDDLLTGGRGDDKLLGQGGDDVLRGGPGKDALKDGPGRNRLSG
jgi:hypothetical protein